ncbi:MAG: trypsin-like peptidase domain-containing protein [Oscillibacter sp.]
MYNDEQNLYHYTYRKDGSETANAPYTAAPNSENDGGPSGPLPTLKPAKKSRMGLKITALALSCALLGGAVGGGIAWAVGNGPAGATSVSISGRPASAVALKTVDGKQEMSDAEVYAANVNSAVSINTSATGVNYFGQVVQSASSGSGFILTTDGYIVTNHHVIEDATAVKVTLYNGESYDASVIGSDTDYDIAVIKIQATGLQAVTLGDSSTLNVGDHVLAVGNPLGELTFSLSGGMVSCVNRAINVSGTPFNMIQTDASINPGNSGGPLFNRYGEVVGIVSAKYSSTGSEGVEGLGFAIPMNDVLAMIQDIMTNGYVTNKAFLGITPGTMTSAMAQQYRYDISEGVFVYSVEEGSAAAKAGLQMGDVITAIDGKKIASVEELTAAKKHYSAGDTATFTLYRGGKTSDVQITWGSVPAEDKTAETPVPVPEQTPNVNPYGGTDPFGGLFDYFFGSQSGGSGSQSDMRSAA